MNKRPIVLGGLTVVALVVGIVGWMQWRFGSLAAGVSYMKGRPVTVDHAIRDLGTVKCGEEVQVAFSVTNLQPESLEVVGAECSCSCLLPPELPIVLEQRTPTPLVLSFHAPPTAMEFEEVIDVLFNGPYDRLQLKIVGMTR